MSKFGTGVPVGSIGICAQCKNKSEVARYPNDNPDPICEDCYRENQILEQKINDKQTEALDVVYPANHPARNGNNSSGFTPSERDRYIQIITSRASDAWVDSFIREVVVKNVLKYDWKEIIKSERWFSVLDLRRFALEVSPNFENDQIREKVNEAYIKIVTRKPRKQRKGAVTHDISK